MARLRLDHARLSRVLGEMEAQRAQLRSRPERARPIIGESLRYLVNYQHQYHHPREDRLYAQLAAARPELRAELHGLEREHRGGARRARALASALRRLSRAGLRGRGGAGFARELQLYVDASRDHMRREERAVFYADVEPLLPIDAWQTLAGELVPDDPLGDPAHLRRRFPHLAAALAQPVRELSSSTRVPAGILANGRSAQSLAVFREGTDRLVDAYGELVHEGVDLVRTGTASLAAAHAPLAALRALSEVGGRGCRLAARCWALPARIALECAQRMMAPFLSGTGDARTRPAHGAAGRRMKVERLARRPTPSKPPR